MKKGYPIIATSDDCQSVKSLSCIDSQLKAQLN